MTNTEFSVKFNVPSKIEHIFSNGKYEIEKLYENTPMPVSAYIEDDNCQHIGIIEGYLLYNTPDFFYKCDNESGDCLVIAKAICGENEMVSFLDEYDGVFILDNIVIEKSHRRLGIGSTIMKNLLFMLQNQFDSIDAVFLCASDFESANKFGFKSQEYKYGTDKLIKFYEKCGYIVEKGSVMSFVIKE